jgi:glucose/arabinose dehydrogenase
VAPRRLVAGVALVLSLGLATLTRAGTPAPGWTDTAYVTGLSDPAAIAFLPDGRLLVAEKGGSDIGAVDAPLQIFDGVSLSTAGTFRACTMREEGLVGVAVDPGFAANGHVYIYFSAPQAGACTDAQGASIAVNRIERVTVGADGTVQAGSATVVLDGIPSGPDGEHNGGGMRVGPDGMLYVGVGDAGVGDNQGGPGTSTNPYAQSLASLNGKMLRLGLDGSVPGDNPFVGRAQARPEIFAYGFRNPWRFGFDPQTNALWAGDVGDFTWEEIDVVATGGNYAFPYCEGVQPTGCEQLVPGPDPVIDPILTYPHGGTGLEGEAVVGGAFAPASGPFAQAGLAGDYFFADVGEPTDPTDGAVWHATPTAARTGVAGTPTMIVGAAGTPVDVVFGVDGALYYAAIGAGEVRRVMPAAVVTTTTAPTTSTTASPTTSTTATTTTAAQSTTTSAPGSTTTTAVAATTTTEPSPTTTTLPGTTCDGLDPASFASIDCRLTVLLARLEAENALGRFAPQLIQQIQRAVEREQAGAQFCADSFTPRARRRLRQAARDLGAYARRLEILAGRRHLAPGVQPDLLAAGKAVEAEVRSLLAALECPAAALR